ncbi:MAG: hypothetical protein DRJ47_03995 [Thermoprotei archaeon]|nr:MAG: hypothetical protein DRJ47_03995 [Thermoprotei archaeon]
MKRDILFRLDKNVSKIGDIRKPRTNDVFKRLLVLPPEKIVLKNLLFKPLFAAFNPAMKIDGNIVKIYARIIIGYFTYSSAVAELTMKLDDIYGSGPKENVEAEVVILPENEVDFWGVEDPRVTLLNGVEFITYTGRTKGFFEEDVNKTVPVVAKKTNGGWSKILYLKLPQPLNQIVSLNKDAFIHMFGEEDKIHVFHRPVFENSPPSLWYGRIPSCSLERSGFNEEIIRDNRILMVPAEYEYNIGWGAPLIEIDGKYFAIAHARGVDEVYRLYLLQLEVDDDGFTVSGVSETYVMEPMEVYEKYGDRPNVVFACGAEVVKDKVIISYGAADNFVAFAEADISSLISLVKTI